MNIFENDSNKKLKDVEMLWKIMLNDVVNILKKVWNGVRNILNNCVEWCGKYFGEYVKYVW